MVAAQLAQESGWNPNATSPAGAQGIAQFMPATWATYGEGGDPFDPDDAIPGLRRVDFLGDRYMFRGLEPAPDGDGFMMYFGPQR